MSWPFLAGVLVDVNLMGLVHLAAMARVRSWDCELKAETNRRVEELREWNTRQYDQSRRDLELPPRRVE